LVFAVVIFVFFAAFATDLGLSFVSKRNLQNGADAGALAAANIYSQLDGSCSDLESDPAAETDAKDAANTVSEENRPGRTLNSSVDGTWTDGYYYISCDADGTALDVGYRIAGTTNIGLGGLFGSTKTAAERSAVPRLGVPSQLEGLRPYMVCIQDAENLSLPANRSSVLPIYFPSCVPKPARTGNWYSVECPPPDDGGGSQLATNTRDGCSSPINIIDTSPLTGPAAVPALKAACASMPNPPTSDGDRGCMVGDTGNDMTSNPVSSAWDSLLGKDIVLPVFDGLSFTGTGKATFPVKALLGVRVCGYHWQGKGPLKSGIVTTGLCAGATAPVPATQDNWLLLKYRRLTFTGSSEPSTCPLGDPDCDLGLRTVSLVQ